MPTMFRSTTLAVTAMLAAGSVQAEQARDPKQFYSEPTRGFFIEHATTANNGQASVELHSGSDGLDSGGGVRLGLQKGELIFNSGLRAYDGNEALLKWAMPDFKTDEESNTPIHWALVGAVSHIELEDESGNDSSEQTNIKLGVAATVTADAGTFTLAPRLVFADGDDAPGGTGKRDDTFVEIDVGAYVGLVDTASGLFSIGFEALFTTEDTRDDTLVFGGRWLYNKHLSLDLIPVVLSDGDQLGLPGLVRVNASF